MKKSEITVFLNTEATKELLESRGYDHIIIAAGSSERRLPIKTEPGMDVRTAIEALNSLDTAENNVVIVGGGLTGCEIAYELARKGREVSIVEMLDDILQTRQLNPANTMMLRNLLKYYNVKIYRNARALAMEKHKLTIEQDGIEKQLDGDTIIVAAGYSPNQKLFNILKKTGMNIYNIGDSRQVGNLLSVIEDAYQCAMSL